MKKFTFIIALAALAFAGCTATREANTTKTTNVPANANSANTATVVNKAEEPAKPAEKPASSDTAAMDSPSATLVTFIEAIKKKDGETIKKCLSKNALTALEATAKEGNMTVDQMIIEGDDMSNEKTPAVRNEKITGDTATLEVEDEKEKKWDTVPFVKEDGNWKIAFDKMKM